MAKTSKKTNVASTTAASGASTKKSAGSGAQFEQGVSRLMALVMQVEQQIEAMGLSSQTPEERMHTMGKLRTGEPEAMNAVFDTMDKFPGVFQALAAKDGGTDPAKVETAPARASLAQSQDLVPVLAGMQALTTRVSDHVLASANTAKGVSVPAYAIGRASAAQDATVRASLAPALQFYGTPSRLVASRAKRAATKQAKAAKKAKSTGA